MLRGTHRIYGFYVNWPSIAEFCKGYMMGRYWDFLIDGNSLRPRVWVITLTISLIWQVGRRRISLRNISAVVRRDRCCHVELSFGSDKHLRLRPVRRRRDVSRIHRK